MEVGLWIVYLGVAFVLGLGVAAVLGDRQARQHERHVH